MQAESAAHLQSPSPVLLLLQLECISYEDQVGEAVMKIQVGHMDMWRKKKSLPLMEGSPEGLIGDVASKLRQEKWAGCCQR